jgi:hypothetical protein
MEAAIFVGLAVVVIAGIAYLAKSRKKRGNTSGDNGKPSPTPGIKK